MNAVIDALAKSITGRSSLADCTLEELRQLSSQFPVFGPGHLLLSAKMKTEENSDFDVQLRKTSLYFRDPLWVSQLLERGSGNATQEVATTSDTLPGVELEEPATVEEVVVQTVKDNSPVETPDHSQQTHIATAPMIEPVGSGIEHPAILDDETEPSAPAASISENLKIPSLDLNDPVNAVSELSFEPYHTVDYFASQGIRFKDEVKSTDRFSQQLRSFTEWLKTMKKIPATETAGSATPVEEKKVEQMAQHSIADREVLTEAMAEVWEKQGDMDKALEIYRKLSLLDPAKSSYFAAKIEHLKR